MLGARMMMAASGVSAEPSATYRDAVLASSPFAYWRFEETEGTTAVDELGNHHGTYVGGPDLSASLIGSAADFNGVDQYVDVGTLGSFGSAMSNGVSFEFSLALADDGVRLFGGANDGNTTLISAEIGRNTSGYINLFVRDESDVLRSRDSSFAINDGSARHFILTYAGDSGYPNIFINGSLANGATESNAAGSSTPPSNFGNFQYPFFLAAFNNRGSLLGPSDALMDDASIYNREIMATEAEAKYSKWLAEAA